MRTEDCSTLSGWSGTKIKCRHKNIMMVPYNPLDWSLNNVATLFNQREFPYNLHFVRGVPFVHGYVASEVAIALSLLSIASVCRVELETRGSADFFFG